MKPLGFNILPANSSLNTRPPRAGGVAAPWDY